MPGIEEFDKLSVAVEDIAQILWPPVDIHLIGVKRHIFVVGAGGTLCTSFGQSVRHNKQFSDVVPIYPKRENPLAVIDAVRYEPIDVNY